MSQEVALPANVTAGEMEQWNVAVQGAEEVEGYSLYGGKENDQALDSLIGVPLVIGTVTFREGDITPPGEKTPRDYVSVECMVHPAHAHKFPRRFVVFNDGSTGIYRQIVRILVRKGIVGVSEELPEEGEANATRYDSSFTTPDRPAVSFSTRILCPEGLRKSEYDGPAGKAVTWYLA